MKPTDAQCLRLSLIKDPSKLSQDELYRAAIYSANVGAISNEERHLADHYRSLLDARRDLSNNEHDRAVLLLGSLKLSDAPAYLEGDRQFLFGIIAQQNGDLRTAASHMSTAAKVFHEEGEIHRFFRACINAEIYQSGIGSFVGGQLFGLGQLCKREGFDDLRGNIQKALSVELLNSGKWKEAETSAREAIASYEKEGSPDDLSVSQCLVAIAQLMMGSRGNAETSIAHVLLKSGKVRSYISAFQSLVSGKTPILPKNHPLTGTPWKLIPLKANSITGKIVRRLEGAPATPDELIAEIWGPKAIHPSYRDRLYSAIKEIRRKGMAQVVFDGEYYRKAG